MNYYLAIDIGASSGRHIVGWVEDGRIKTDEIYRFPNGVESVDGHLTWNIDALAEHVKRGVDMARARYSLRSLAIDTWGVDYVLLRGDEEIRPCYAYRDERTAAAIEAVHALVPFAELYRRTGCQFQPFNTVYQLYSDKLAGRLEEATDFLMMPEYLLWKLCGGRAREYTNAGTTGLLNAAEGCYDREIIRVLGLPERLFPALAAPGTVVGTYEGISCRLCATHDTASAVEGIPMEGEEPYISSGTWSLLGVKVPTPITDEKSREANYSNEAGVGYTRYQKNIMGMWLINELHRELCPGKRISEIVREAEASGFDKTVDANAPAFLSPRSMKEAFDAALGEAPRAAADYFRCAIRSLALSYRDALRELQSNTGRTYQKLYIVGGGAKNDFLNRLTAETAGIEVIALPIEATALGNLKVQMEADK